MKEHLLEVTVWIASKRVGRYLLRSGAYLLGRDPTSCQIIVDSPDVSQKHARLLIESAEVRLEDLGSSNGSFVAGNQVVRQAALRLPQQLRLGSALIELQWSEMLPPAASDIHSTDNLENASASDSPQPDSNYLIAGEIAKGGMGRILEAHDLKLDRVVAMKVILSGNRASPETVHHFEQEARVIAKLEHPNIVPIHDLGKDQHGQAFYTMKRIHGRSLHQVLEDIKDRKNQTIAEFPLTRLLTTFQKVCDAVFFAHSKGVIHCDLKPANIMIGEYGEALVMDWGLARLLNDEKNKQRRIQGSWEYMAPEQLTCKGILNERTDIYALGGVLSAILSLRPPIEIVDSDTVESISERKKTLDQSPTLSNRRVRELKDHGLPHMPGGTIPNTLWAVAMKALHTKPENRHQTVAELQKDITDYQERGFAPSIEDPSTVTLARLWIEKHPTACRAAATSVLILAAATIFSSWQALRAISAERTARAGQVELRKSVASLQTRSGLSAHEQGHDAVATLWFAHALSSNENDPTRMNLAHLRVQNWSRILPRPLRAKDVMYDRESTLTFHQSGDYVLVRVAGPSFVIWDIVNDASINLPVSLSPIAAAEFSHDGKRLILAGATGTIDVYSFPALRQEFSFNTPGRITCMALNSADDFLAVASVETPPASGGRINTVLRLWNLNQRSSSLFSLGKTSEIELLRFDAKGGRVVAVCADYSAQVFQIGASSSLVQLSFPDLRHGRDSLGWSHRFPPAFFDQDRALLTMRQPTELVWWDSGRKAEVRAVRLRNGSDITCWAVDPHDRFLIVAGFRMIQVWDIEKKILVSEFEAHRNTITDISFVGDGTFLSASIDRTTKTWSLPRASSEHTLVFHTYEVRNVAAHPDGWGFATLQADGLAQVWSYGADAPVRGRAIPVAENRSLAAMSPNGKVIAPSGSHYRSGMFGTQVYDLDARPIGPRIPVAGLLLAAAFSPNNSQLAIAWLPESNTTDTSRGPIESANRPGKIEFCDVLVGTSSGSISTPSLPLECRYSPNGKHLVVLCAGGEILGIDVNRMELEFRSAHPREDSFGFLRTTLVRSRWLDFTPDGKGFLTCGSSVCLWNPETGERSLGPMDHGDACFDFDVSSDGRYVATACKDKRLRIWDLSSGRLAAKEIQHPDWLFRTRFSKNGEYVLTACRDGGARIWNWRTGFQVGPTLIHSDEVFGAEFLEEKGLVVTGTRGGRMCIWDWRTAQQISPPIAIGLIPQQMRLAPDGFHVVLGDGVGLLGPRVFDLSSLVQGDSEVSSNQEMIARAELWSASEIRQNDAISPLTSKQWSERWQEIKRGKLAPLPSRW